MEIPSLQDSPVTLDQIIGNLVLYLKSLQDDGVNEVSLEKLQMSKHLLPQAPSPEERMPRPGIKEPRAQVPDDPIAGKDLAAIASQIAACTRCSLHVTRTKTVPGQGQSHPDILFVGEGPGADEDIQGLAFVGRAGQLLTRLITRMGYRREDVFIANVVKCRPPENRKPLPEEMQACLPYLKAQITALNPKVIVTLGATALEGITNATDRIAITRMRGKWLSYNDIPLMPTFHPSYLLRNQSAMWDVWNDMLEVLKHLGRTPPPAPAKGK